MSSESLYSTERVEALTGCPAVEVVKAVFALNPEIKTASLQSYHYESTIPSPLSLVSFNPDEVHLESLIEGDLQPGFDIGIYSRVELRNGSLAHLPMIDFDLPVSLENLLKTENRLAKLAGLEIFEGSWWTIMDSGYHYQAYCLNKLLPVAESDEKTILDFAEKCHQILDLDKQGRHDEIIHGWWFIHSAQRKGMVLRLTRNREE